MAQTAPALPPRPTALPGGTVWVAGSVAIALLLAIPIGVVGSSVFLPESDAWTHLVATVLPEYVTTTLILMIAVGVGVSAVGVSSAWFVTAYEFPGRRTLEWALLLPLAVPAYVVAYAYTDWLQFSGPVQTWIRSLAGWQRGDYWFPEIRSVGGAAAMFVCVLYPYVYLLTRLSFLEQSPSLIEAGRTLGLAPRAAFLRVSLPLARPAIAAGAALALMETLADFGTVAYFGVQTFTTGIFRAWLSMGDRVAAAKLSVMLLAFVAVLVLAERSARRRAQFHGAHRPTARKRRELRGMRAALAFGVCVLPLAAGFVVPAVLLVNLSGGGDTAFGMHFVRPALNSAALGAVTAALAVAIALLLAYAARLSRSPFAIAANRAVGLGYAVPGAVIAIGVLITLTTLDRFIGDAAGVSTGVLVTGSLAALVYAYLARFLGVALQTVEAGLAQVTLHMEDAARSLGMGPAATLARVHAPMIRPSLITAALLVFVDVMKELPATFVMRPFNFDTLAVQAYNFAADERLAEAATVSLAIVAVALPPVILASRRLLRGDPRETGSRHFQPARS